MRTEFVCGSKALEDVASVWRALESRLDPPVFRTLGWARAWMAHVSQGGVPLILLAGEPVSALLGLVLERRGPLRILRLIGHGLSDYPGALGADGEVGLWRAIGERLRSESRRFDLLELGGLDADHGARRALAGAIGLQSAERLYERCPIVDTSGTWEELLQTRSRKFRKNVRQAANRVRAQGAVSVDCGSGSAKIFEEMLSVERDSWKWDQGSSYTQDPRLRDFLATVITSGEVRHEVWTCRVDNELAGFAVVFPHRRRRIDYLSSYRERFGDVGSFLLAEMIRSCCDGAFDELDLGQGDESYKVAWQTRERQVWDVVAQGGRAFSRPAYHAVRLRWWVARSARLRRLRARFLARRQLSRSN